MSFKKFLNDTAATVHIDKKVYKIKYKYMIFSIAVILFVDVIMLVKIYGND